MDTNSGKESSRILLNLQALFWFQSSALDSDRLSFFTILTLILILYSTCEHFSDISCSLLTLFDTFVFVFLTDSLFRRSVFKRKYKSWRSEYLFLFDNNKFRCSNTTDLSVISYRLLERDYVVEDDLGMDYQRWMAITNARTCSY